MIKPNELRLGNYVKYPFHELQVCQLFVDSFQGMYVGGKGCYMYESCDGIPLTSEWLLKFGFTEHPVSWSTDISYFPQSYKTICVTLSQGIMIREGDRIQERSKDDVCVLWNTDVRGPIMVHNLQNIYYALTGEELTIKE